ncbi:uncharacterized protein A4U43_C04F34350 [Asparagus officinalis]|uniref:Uncharacterized protein n=1 Tax=Asparagus officinalis TaxID=4686 RepID=A0A5P1FAA4_ASPOF|nr:uncharacterized protein At5g23160-like [Asparagus officinalis]ONK73699.1 uncharacterized protein A4U43_C04F34350 [Asparagus officinalis]
MSTKLEAPNETRNKRRSSCLSSCFSSSPVYESDELESALDSKLELKRENRSWFSRSTFHSKKKKAQKKKKAGHVVVDVAESSTPSGKENKDRLQSQKAKRNKHKLKPQIQQQEQRLQARTNTVSQITSLPEISFKYNSSRPRARSRPEPVQTTTRTQETGSSKPELDRHAKLDPTVGLLVLGITLATMLVCGRVCAVMCLCACFYVLPLLRGTPTTKEDNGYTKNDENVDLESEEYKKRVVLGGLLERNGRRP